MLRKYKAVKLLSFWLVLCLLTTNISVFAHDKGNNKSPSTPSVTQSETKKTEKAERENGFTAKTVATAYLIQNGIIHGNANGAFTMSSKIKRGDFIIMLVRAFKLKANGKGNFKDILKNCYYYDAVAAAKALGITTGDGKGNFWGEKYITVKDAMTLIERAVKIANPAVKLPANTNLATAFATLTPASYATREQVGQMLYYVLTAKTDGAAIATGEKPDSSKDDATVVATGKYTLSTGTDTLTNGTIAATDPNMSAIKVNNKAVLNITGYTITKAGDTTSAASSDNLGLNAGVLAMTAGQINITGSTVTTGAKGASALYATGEKTVITAKNVVASTTAEASRGLAVSSKGSIIADTVEINTNAPLSAAVAVVRDGGTLSITNSKLKTNGTDSPGIYSSGDVTISGSTVTASASEAAVIAGKNKLTLLNSTLSSAKKHGILLYNTSESTGDAKTSLTMTGGSLNAIEGPLFYITNTSASINLSGALLTSASGVLLKASADQWGKSGANGGSVTVTADNQKLIGDILTDSISTVSMVLKNGSFLTGKINTANTGKVSVSLDATSKWIVTGTSYVWSLAYGPATLVNIDDNGNTIYYSATNSQNSWLKGATYTLPDGGVLKPIV